MTSVGQWDRLEREFDAQPVHASGRRSTIVSRIDRVMRTMRNETGWLPTPFPFQTAYAREAHPSGQLFVTELTLYKWLT